MNVSIYGELKHGCWKKTKEERDDERETAS